MAAKVTIDVTLASGQKRAFSYQDHDTFIVGRQDDCHVYIPDDDYLSRHHFLLEVNPPNARLQDLGSLNGTYVNGKKFGGRKVYESPEEAKSKYQIPWVLLNNGDIIKTGGTIFNLVIQSPNLSALPVKCRKCGRDVSKEIGAAVGGSYICENCQKIFENSPFELLQQFIDERKPLTFNPNIVGNSQHQRQGFSNGTPVEISDFDIIKVLGAGGTGAAYLLKHQVSGKDYALKLMMPKTAADTLLQDRYLKETEEVQQLKHNSLVPFFESGFRNGIFYFLMEYCNFGNIYNLRKNSRVPLTETILTSLQVLEALTLAHSEGYVHRDFKPQNILLKQTNGSLTAKISDFGLMKHFSQVGLGGMTVTSGFTGSYPFIPREQVVDFKNSKPMADIWSLGATIYNLLTGDFPRDFPPGRDPLEVILQGNIVPIRERDPSIPEDIAAVIDRAVQNDPAHRYQHAGEMLSTLRRIWKRKK